MPDGKTSKRILDSGGVRDGLLPIFLALSRRGAVIGIHQFLDRYRDILVVVIELDQNKLGENLRVDDDARTFHRSHPRLAMRQVLLQILVGLILVA